MSDSEAEAGVPLIEPEFDTNVSIKDGKSKKRKREDENDLTEKDKSAVKREKRREQRRRKANARFTNADDLDEALGVNRAFERMDSRMIGDYFNAKTKLYGKDLSSVELEDQYLPGHSIQDTSSFSGEKSTDSMANFLKAQSNYVEAVPKHSKHAPHTIVVTASGIRAADVVRALKAGLGKSVQVAKLFSKHMKIGEQVAHLKKQRVDVGVGTPDRLSALFDVKALTNEHLQRVVIDVSYIDQKKRGILDMKELHGPLLKLLLRDEFKGKDGQIRNDMFVFY